MGSKAPGLHCLFTFVSLDKQVDKNILNKRVSCRFIANVGLGSERTFEVELTKLDKPGTY